MILIAPELYVCTFNNYTWTAWQFKQERILVTFDKFVAASYLTIPLGFNHFVFLSVVACQSFYPDPLLAVSYFGQQYLRGQAIFHFGFVFQQPTIISSATSEVATRYLSFLRWTAVKKRKVEEAAEELSFDEQRGKLLRTGS